MRIRNSKKKLENEAKCYIERITNPKIISIGSKLDLKYLDIDVKSDDELCSICLNELNPIDYVVQHGKNCGHIFHKKCIQEWHKLLKNDNCPFCKC